MRYLFRLTLLAVFSVTLAVVSLGVNVGARAQQSPFSDMTKIADNVYSFRFITHRNIVVLTDEGVIISDPINPKAAEMLMAEIRKLTDKPVKYVLYSHNHWDHIAGGRIFKEQGATFVQHELSAKATRANPMVVPADKTYSGAKHVITLGGETVELHYPGDSHGTGLVVMLLPRHKILHTVDIVTPSTPGRLPIRGMPDSSPARWVAALKNVEQLDFDRIIPGHGPAVAPRETVVEIRQYLEDLYAAVTAARKQVENPFAFDKITEIVKETLRPKYGGWEQFDNWIGMNVERVVLDQLMGA